MSPRNGLIKTALLTGAALAMPPGFSEIFASESKPAKPGRNRANANLPKKQRTLGAGKTALEASALGLYVMSTQVPLDWLLQETPWGCANTGNHETAAPERKPTYHGVCPLSRRVNSARKRRGLHPRHRR